MDSCKSIFWVHLELNNFIISFVRWRWSILWTHCMPSEADVSEVEWTPARANKPGNWRTLHHFAKLQPTLIRWCTVENDGFTGTSVAAECILYCLTLVRAQLTVFPPYSITHRPTPVSTEESRHSASVGGQYTTLWFHYFHVHKTVTYIQMIAVNIVK